MRYMSSTKLNFILKQISKTNKKNCENYVVTRIYNLLNDLDIKFITQQYVSRGNNKYALTDMYFPQFNLHVEIDEPHHKKFIEVDKIREEDIVNMTNSKVMRVDFTKSLDEIHNQIYEIVHYINVTKRLLKDKFIPWDADNESNPERFINLGYIKEDDKVAFRTIYEACNCFGLNYKGFQRGGTKHPREDSTLIWFPKLYVNDLYSNKISEDGKTIFESNKKKVFNEEDILKEVESDKFLSRRIVFGKVIGPLGEVEYKFKGEFEIDKNQSAKCKCFVWRKKSDNVKTYRYIEKIGD